MRPREVEKLMTNLLKQNTKRMLQFFKLMTGKDALINKIHKIHKTPVGTAIEDWAICEVQNENYVYFVSKIDELRDHLKSFYKSEDIDPETLRTKVKDSHDRYAITGNKTLFLDK